MRIMGRNLINPTNLLDFDPLFALNIIMMQYLLIILLSLFINNQIHSQTMEQNWSIIFPHGCDTNLHMQETLMKKRIQEFIHLDSSTLDFSMKSLRLIDEGLDYRGLRKNSEFKGPKLNDEESNLFPAILFYFGEIIKKRVKGEWKYDHVKGSNNIYVPWILSLEEKEFDFYGYVEEYFFRNDDGSTLVSCMDIILTPVEIFGKVEKLADDLLFFPRFNEETGHVESLVFPPLNAKEGVNEPISDEFKQKWSFLFPYGCEKNLHTKEAIMKKRIAEFISIDSSQLDFSIESLHLIDEGLDNKEFIKNSALINIQLSDEESNLFPAIMFYFGEIIKRHLKGEWQYDEIPDKTGKYVPYILSSECKEVDFDGYIQQYFYRNNDKRTLFAFINIILFPK